MIIDKLGACGSSQRCNSNLKGLGSDPSTTEGYELPTDIESILDVEHLPESYNNLEFPREWMLPLLPFGVNSNLSGSHEDELHALRTEIAVLKDRVSELETTRNITEQSLQVWTQFHVVP